LKQVSVGQIKCHVPLQLEEPVELNTHELAFKLSCEFAPERGCYVEAQFSDAIEAHYSNLFNKTLVGVVDAHGNTDKLDAQGAVYILKALSHAMMREGRLLDKLLELWKPVALDCGLHPVRHIPTDDKLLSKDAWLLFHVERDGSYHATIHTPRRY